MACTSCCISSVNSQTKHTSFSQIYAQPNSNNTSIEEAFKGIADAFAAGAPKAIRNSRADEKRTKTQAERRTLQKNTRAKSRRVATREQKLINRNGPSHTDRESDAAVCSTRRMPDVSAPYGAANLR